MPTESGLPEQPALISELPPAPRPSQVWGGWATFGLGCAIAGGWLICQLVVTIVYALRQIAGNPGINVTQLAQSVQADAAFLSLVTIISAVVGLGLIVVFILAKRNSKITDYLAIKKTSIKYILIALGVTLLLVLVELLISINSNTESQFSNDMVTAYKNSAAPYLLWIAIVLVAPLFEEAFFRGFLYAGFAQSRLRAPGAIVLTALAWAAMHASQYGIIDLTLIFVVGIALGTMRWRTKSIWNCLIMHVLFNAAAMIELALLNH